VTRVAVLGLGLIGGSIAQALPLGDVVGYDPDPAVRRTAATAGLQVVDSVAAAVRDVDLVVLAAPVSANDALLAALPPELLLTDVGSVKAPIARAWQAAGGTHRLVPGHPMAGAETAGWAAAAPNLFVDARWVLCPGPWAPASDWAAVCGVALSLGAQVVPADPVEHDAAAARISHAPHVAAAVLARVALGGATPQLARSLAAGSFRDMTRVTASPPERTAEFCFANREATAEVLRELAAGLAAAAAALDAGRDEVQAVLAAGHDSRLGADAARRPGGQREVSVDAADPQWSEPLIELGRAGGVIGALRVEPGGFTVSVTLPEV
jgi:prephenate dehydrogenase